MGWRVRGVGRVWVRPTKFGLTMSSLEHSRLKPLAYGAAVFLTLSIFGARALLGAWMGDRPLLILFVLPFLASAYLGGFGPCLLSTAIGAAGTFFMFVPRNGISAITNTADLLQWSVLIVCGIALAFGAERLHGLRRASEAVFRERLEAVEAARRSQEQLEAVVEHMAEGLVIADATGQILRWNTSALRLHGFSSSDEWALMLPEFGKIFEVSDPNGAVLPLERWPLSRILHGEQFDLQEIRVRRLGSDWERVFSCRGSMVDNPEGQPLAFLTLTDVTDRARAEAETKSLHAALEDRVRSRTAELELANRELESFSYTVSHDLRSPLRAINGYASMLAEDCRDVLPDDGIRRLEMIERQSTRLGSLIDDLLDFSRLGRQAINRRVIDVGVMVQEVVEELSGRSGDRSLEFNVGELPPCLADGGLLRQVWANLIGNAIKYSGKRASARIEIGCDQVDGEPVYFVKDDGVGFDMAHAGHLFEVFHRLQPKEYEGTGVGLAIVHRVVTRHGGNVWAEGRPEEGATFFFTVPPPGTSAVA